MKLNNKIFVILVTVFCWSLYLPAVSSAQRGVVLIAHGSINEDWNIQIRAFYGRIEDNIPYPSKLAFLRFSQDTIQAAVEDLRDRATNILLVHLAPSSYSERHNEIHDIKNDIVDSPDLSLDLKVSPAMDSHPLAIEILKGYAKELSRDPEYESLILLGYGAAGELLNIAWIKQLERIGKMIQAELGFREVACLTLRNHSADLIRAQAILDLQSTARRLREKGRVIVVPYVLCMWEDDSFQRELKSCLRGIVPPKNIGTKGIMTFPTTKVEEWVMEVIENETSEHEFRDANQVWSAMDAEKKKPIGTNKYNPDKTLNIQYNMNEKTLSK